MMHAYIPFDSAVLAACVVAVVVLLSFGRIKAAIAPVGVMDRILVVECLFLLGFVAAVLFIFWHRGSEPVALIGAVFALCGTQNGIMGWIKTAKENKKQTEEDLTLVEREEPPDVGN